MPPAWTPNCPCLAQELGVLRHFCSLQYAARVASLGNIYSAALAVAGMFSIKNANNSISLALKCVISVGDIGRIEKSN